MDRLSDDRVREFACLPYMDDVLMRPIIQRLVRALALEVLAARAVVADVLIKEAFDRLLAASEPKEVPHA